MVKVFYGGFAFKLIFAILWLVLFVWALVDILEQKKSTDWKAIWIIVCLVFPVLGVLLYFLVGKK